jgi:hypothetical protein
MAWLQVQPLSYSQQPDNLPHSPATLPGGGYYSLVGFPLFQGEGVDVGFTSGWIYDATVLSSSTNVNPQNVSVCSGGFEGTQFASTRDVQSKSGTSLSIDVYNSLFGLNSDFQK